MDPYRGAILIFFHRKDTEHAGVFSFLLSAERAESKNQQHPKGVSMIATKKDVSLAVLTVHQC